MTTVLITGIEPFESDPTNPSWDIARALDGERIDGATLVARQLPCVFGRANRELVAAIEATQPSLVLALGLASGRSELSVERVAINVIDARIPDNAGNQPVDVPVVADGPAAYFSSLPIKAIVHALRAAGVPAAVSQSAGTYNCNHLFYGLMHHIATRAPRMRGGFIHVPATPELAARHPGRPSLRLDAQIAGMRVAVQTALATQGDLRLSGGTLH
ncbi:Pyrrolidone-carboxylate peptidase 2 [Ralstonia solanacearum]|uniref:pyroglutamyl-peptidase I n=1 Tax=Ralstonia pseudosolanacearum TaxID=1310165 RepID=UPI000DAB5F90|nr:pyroglutamyl-peptidase I [Ralstonia pseudosolanacearum]AXV71304.1 pyroglutamyl-peptidase I [Ralstonia solanacearum]AXV97811.1 pyroglutamyl-peptidase I [Ralstonia solanacearum]AXW02985.1 pyroglutamyl-peptidase I [Ralstonia solanacearum]AXW12452.1 pyroglutamyl-peptidase I [Ralstonia solanacearum]AXW30474.1 pyroglutamyl-peptidase I [Ralstonia solanacearum]